MKKRYTPNQKLPSIFLFSKNNRECSYKPNLRTQGLLKQSLPNQPIISVITVVFNGEKYLEQTIQSVINQSYKNLEYIIIDGGSQDGTIDIIKKYENKIYYWVSEADNGIYDAMNKGICMCKGDIVGILNAGDTYLSNTIDKVVDAYLRTELSAIIVGNCRQMLSKISKWNISSGHPKKLPFKMIPHISTFVPLKFYKNYGIFDINLKIAGDYDFICRCYKQGVEFLHIDEVIATADPPGVSSNYYLTEFEYLQIRCRYNFPLFKTIMISTFSFIRITIHKFLEYIGVWNLIELNKHGKNF